MCVSHLEPKYTFEIFSKGVHFWALLTIPHWKYASLRWCRMKFVRSARISRWDTLIWSSHLHLWATGLLIRISGCLYFIDFTIWNPIVIQLGFEPPDLQINVSQRLVRSERTNFTWHHRKLAYFQCGIVKRAQKWTPFEKFSKVYFGTNCDTHIYKYGTPVPWSCPYNHVYI